jgi:hypothetical protein
MAVLEAAAEVMVLTIKALAVAMLLTPAQMEHLRGMAGTAVQILVEALALICTVQVTAVTVTAVLAVL